MSKKNGHLQLRSHPRTELRQTLQTLPALLDAEVGLIQTLEWYQPRHDEPQFIHCHATMPDLTRLTGRICSRATGGTALVKEVAMAKAIGESVERYCGDLFNEREITYAPYTRVREQATDPRRFMLFHPQQYRAPDFPFRAVTAETIIGWVEGFSLTRSQPTLVPASLVHLTYEPPDYAQVFEQGPVSGYACGNTAEEALLGALLEVIERDSLMVCWYNYLPVPAFDLTAIQSPALRQTLDRYHSAPVRLHCASITTDLGIPAALAVMTSRAPGWPAAVVATAADLNAEGALTRALQELSANHLYIRSYFENPQHPLPRAPHEVVNQEDHGLFYCVPERLRALDVVLRPRWQVRAETLSQPVSEDVKENLEFCVKRLAAFGLEVIAVELTTSDVAALGFKVFKVLVPGLQPIDFGVAWPHIGGRRLYEAPVRMGYRPAPPQPWELNYYPHPFP